MSEVWRPGSQRQVMLGVTGSIAAYKSAELVRLMTKAGLSVRVIMTRAATEFISPVTMSTLSGHPLTVDLFGPPEGNAAPYGDSPGADASSAHEEASSSIEHIRASRQSDLIVVAPATANLLGKIAGGIADDALTTTLLASSAPVLMAPAMNTRMWEHPAVVENVRKLRGWGVRFADPGSGDLACGEVGAGRMAEPEEILGSVFAALNAQAPVGPAVLVTAGGTEEALDPVRSLSNRSSGRMGMAVAEMARDFGCPVTVVKARTEVPTPPGVEVVPVRSAEEMHRAVRTLHTKHPILVMAAAVADYRPRTAAKTKVRSDRETWSLELRSNPDILASLKGKRRSRVTVGFALETGSAARGLSSAKAKLEKKGADVIVLNDPTRRGSEFGSTLNQVTLVTPNEPPDRWPLLEKREVARRILEKAFALLEERT